MYIIYDVVTFLLPSPLRENVLNGCMFLFNLYLFYPQTRTPGFHSLGVYESMNKLVKREGFQGLYK